MTMGRGGGGEEGRGRVWMLLGYSIGIHTHTLTYNTSLYIRERQRRIQRARQDPHTDYAILKLHREAVHILRGHFSIADSSTCASESVYYAIFARITAT